MAAYQDKKTGKWYCTFRIKNHEGRYRQVKKSGFKLKRDALDYEREYKDAHNFSPNMSFKSFFELFCRDTNPRLKETTISERGYRVNKRIMPFFSSMKMNEIDVKDVVRWQNKLLKENLAPASISIHHRTLSSIFNHAVRYYKLPENPARLAGNPGSLKSTKEMSFWTLDEFNKAYEAIEDLKSKTAISLLYWSGIRKGELLALTWNDIDFETKIMNIDKTYHRFEGRALVTEPKTPSSKRKIMLPEQVLDLLKEYQKTLYNTSDDARVFHWEMRFIEKGIMEAVKKAGVKRIRVHDLRHSHASFLINSGANAVLISKRLGHTRTSITLDVYSHLYPSKEKNLIDLMEDSFSSSENSIQ